jgi:REDY-like protein HapK
MADRVFIFYRLKPGVDQKKFEQRARDVEAPLAARSPAILRYVLTRLEDVLEGEAPAPFDYVEALDVTTLEEYRSGVTDAEVDAFIKEWEEDVAEYALVHGRIVSES